ncbi:MAG: hypothetical protein ACJ71Y_06070, partial [Blastococcus sp.]
MLICSTLICSTSVAVDSFITDREGGFGWTVPSEEQFRSSFSQVGELGGYLGGRRLYQTMLPRETDPSMCGNELGATFADVWCALPKVVFSRTPFLSPVTETVPLELIETRTF